MLSGLWQRADYRRLLLAQAASGLGDWLATFAFIALVFDITGSPAAVGVVLVLRLAPALLAGSLMARVAARWSPRRVMLSMDALRAAVVLVLPFVRQLWWVYLWAAVLEVAGLLFVPPRDASIADLVEEDQLPAANGLILGSSYATIPLGAALFSLVSAFGAGDRFFAAFWLDAATFVVSYVFIARIAALPDTVEAPAEGPHLRMRDAMSLPLVRAALAPIAAVALGAGTLFSLGIVFVVDVLGASEAQFGVLIIVFGLGAGAGVGLLALRRPADHVAALRVGTLILGVVLAVMSMAPNVAVALAGALAFGAAAGYSIVAGMTGLQVELSERQRILAFGLFHVAVRVALIAGAALAGLITEGLETLDLPLVREVEPARAMLLLAALIMLAGARGLAPGTTVDRRADPMPDG